MSITVLVKEITSHVKFQPITPVTAQILPNASLLKIPSMDVQDFVQSFVLRIPNIVQEEIQMMGVQCLDPAFLIPWPVLDCFLYAHLPHILTKFDKWETNL